MSAITAIAAFTPITPRPALALVGAAAVQPGFAPIAAVDTAAAPASFASIAQAVPTNGPSTDLVPTAPTGAAGQAVRSLRLVTDDVARDELALAEHERDDRVVAAHALERPEPMAPSWLGVNNSAAMYTTRQAEFVYRPRARKGGGGEDQQGGEGDSNRRGGRQ